MGVINMSEVTAVQKPAEEGIKKNRMIRMSDVPDFGHRKEKEFMHVTHRKISDVFKPDQWKGQRCFVIAGGESVKDFDLSLLEKEHTIAVNLAFRLFEPEIIYGMDARLWGWIENDETGPGDCERYTKSKAVKVWSDFGQAPMPEDYVVAPSIGRPGLSRSLAEGLGVGTNSGYGALNLALLLGASEIYLIGFDFYGSRWHSGYPTKEPSDHNFHLQCYEESTDEFKKFGSRIINLNPKSGLKIFEFGELKELTGETKRTEAPVEVEQTSPVFVSFFDKSVDEEVVKVKASANAIVKSGLDYDIQSVKLKGKKENFLPSFLIKMINKYPGRPIIWGVPGTRILSVSDEVRKGTLDSFAFREAGQRALNTMYIPATKVAYDIMKKWENEVSSNPEESLYFSLQNVLDRQSPNPVVYEIKKFIESR